jgi:hypothetical protein
MVAAIADAVIAPKPGMLISLLRQLCDDATEPGNRFVEVPQLHDERRERLAHFKWDCFVAVLEQLSQFVGVSVPLRREHADLGQVPAQGVQQLRALRDQHLARLVPH